MRVVRIAWLLVCLGVGIPLAASSWAGYPVEGMVLYVRPGQERVARSLLPVVREEASRIAGELGVTKIRLFPIYAYASRGEFFRDTGRQPDLLGESLSPGGEIHIDVSGSRDPPRRVLAHELAHSLLDQRLGMYGGLLPHWVNEGLAGHLSDPVSTDQLAGVSNMIHRDGVLSLSELEEAFPSGPYRDAAYLQSRSMIAWLVWQHPGAVRRMIDALADGRSFHQALRSAAGLTAEEWLARWRRSVPAIIYWLTYLSSPVVYSPLAAILIWVFIRRLLRKRAKEAEENEPEAEVEKPEETQQFLEDM